MSLDYRKPNMTFAMLVMVLLIALLSPKTLLALELDISAAVIDVTEAGPAQQHKIFLSRLKMKWCRVCCADKPTRQLLIPRLRK
jgi:hypothetical protein